METWGELFWHSWIRFRISCRRLVRTYLPRHVEPWQVYTTTGIVSVLLTLVALNYQSGAVKSAGGDSNDPATGKIAATKPSSQKSAVDLISESDPFAESLEATDAPPVQDLGTIGDSDTGSDVLSLNPKVARKSSSLDLEPMDDPTLAQTESVPTEFQEATNPIAVPEADVAQPVESPLEDPDLVAAAGPPSTPAKSNDGLLVARHTPLATPIRSNSHYSRIGDGEDTEDDRHPVSEIRPTRIDRVLVPTNKPAVPGQDNVPTRGSAPDEQPELTAPPQEQPESPPELEAPKAARQPKAGEALAEPENAPEIPAVEPFEAPRGNGNPFGPEPPTAEPEPVMTEPSEVELVEEGPPPPVVFAPESQAEPFEPTPAPKPMKSSEYLGPVRSTDPVDHKGHEADDVFEGTKRRKVVPSDVPATPTEPPVTTDELPPVEPLAPVVAPPSAATRSEHEEHQADDVFEGIKRRKLVPSDVPETRTDSPAVTDELPPVEPLAPVVATPSAATRSEHEDHQAEDVFEGTKRRKVAPGDVPEARTDSPAVTDEPSADEPLAPIVATPSAAARSEHEEHQQEDVFSGPKRKSTARIVPAPESPAPETEPETPQSSERRKPVEAPTTTPRTAPRTTPRTAPQESTRSEPRFIHEDDEHSSNVTNQRVTPMAVTGTTQPRGAGRITIPDRMPPVTPPSPVEYIGRRVRIDDPPATSPRSTNSGAPRLVMEITGPKQAPVGTQVVMHFKVQNLGSASATGIVVSDVLPPGMQHRLSPDLEYTIPRLDPGESRETNLTVLCTNRGLITNKAVLRADGDVTTEAEFQVEVTSWSTGGLAQDKRVHSPLTVAHHGPAHWLVDSTGQFLVTVTNTSGERQRNVTISHVFPKGTELVHATIGHKVDALNRTVTWTIPDFAPGVAYILETELHSLTSGPGTSVVRVKIGDAEVAEDRWTAISDGGVIRR